MAFLRNKLAEQLSVHTHSEDNRSNGNSFDHTDSGIDDLEDAEVCLLELRQLQSKIEDLQASTEDDLIRISKENAAMLFQAATVHTRSVDASKKEDIINGLNRYGGSPEIAKIVQNYNQERTERIRILYHANLAIAELSLRLQQERNKNLEDNELQNVPSDCDDVKQSLAALKIENSKLLAQLESRNGRQQQDRGSRETMKEEEAELREAVLTLERKLVALSEGSDEAVTALQQELDQKNRELKMQRQDFMTEFVKMEAEIACLKDALRREKSLQHNDNDNNGNENNNDDEDNDNGIENDCEEQHRATSTYVTALIQRTRQELVERQEEISSIKQTLGSEINLMQRQLAEKMNENLDLKRQLMILKEMVTSSSNNNINKDYVRSSTDMSKSYEVNSKSLEIIKLQKECEKLRESVLELKEIVHVKDLELEALDASSKQHIHRMQHEIDEAHAETQAVAIQLEQELKTKNREIARIVIHGQSDVAGAMDQLVATQAQCSQLKQERSACEERLRREIGAEVSKLHVENEKLKMTEARSRAELRLIHSEINAVKAELEYVRQDAVRWKERCGDYERELLLLQKQQEEEQTPMNINSSGSFAYDDMRENGLFFGSPSRHRNDNGDDGNGNEEVDYEDDFQDREEDPISSAPYHCYSTTSPSNWSRRIPLIPPSIPEDSSEPDINAATNYSNNNSNNSSTSPYSLQLQMITL